MRMFSTVAAGLFVVAGGAFLVGCTSSDGGGAASPATPPATADTDQATDHSEHGDHAGHGDHSGGGDHAEHGGDDAMAKMKAGLAKLSDEDRASAEKQHMCPVSDKMLGTMGEPIKLTLKDQAVWICCEGCKKAAEDDADAIIAKVTK